MTVKEVFELRKQGRIEEAYQTIVPMYKVHHGHYTSICMFRCGADMAKLHIERKEHKKAERILASLAGITNHSLRHDHFLCKPRKTAQ